jgi:hypothetical protein
MAIAIAKKIQDKNQLDLSCQDAHSIVKPIAAISTGPLFAA